MPKLVIIEDDRTILEMYSVKFRSEGFTVYQATNGEEGLEVLYGTDPDIILLDLMMPVMDGTTMLKKLRSTPWGKTIPVIILTNISSDEMPRELEKLNVADSVVKASTTPHLLAEKVKEVLKK